MLLISNVSEKVGSLISNVGGNVESHPLISNVGASTD